MDKKSNRTDLLAAGRKKLQQYRQKKDNKGKDGKGKDGKGSSRSTSKADKSEQNDADASLVSADDTAKAESSQVPKAEIESSANSVHSTIDNQKDLEITEGIPADSQKSVDLPSLDNLSDETSLKHKLDIDTLTGEGQVEIGAPEAEESVISGHTDFNTEHVDVTPQCLISSPKAVEMAAAVFVEAKGLLEGDQVSVVGAMQEADSIDLKHSDRSAELELGRDEIPPDSTTINEKVLTLNPEELGGSGGAGHSFKGDHERVEASIPVETTPLGAKITDPEKLSNQGDDLNQREEIQVHLDQTIVEGYHETVLSEASRVIHVKSFKDTAECNLGGSTDDRTLCLGVQGDSLDLVQLAEVLKRLPESDFRYLIKSREMIDHADLLVPKNVVGAFTGTLQEQLYLANVSKDFLHLQLQEQVEQQTDPNLGEVAALSELLSDVEECKKRLSVELDQCKYELEVAVNDKLNFQNLYNAAKEESVEFSAKIDELKLNLDNSVMHISSISSDLANTKDLLEASQVENEKLLKSLSLVSEQRNKFEEAMQQYSLENQKLSQDMVDSGTQLAALEQEICDLKITLASMADERKKIVEDKEFSLHEKEILSGNLAQCKREIVALEQENSGLQSSLAVLTEESKKLKEHDEFLALEFERLSTELIVYKDKVLMQHQVVVQLGVELKESMLRVEQMAEENIVLHSSLEIYKSRIAEIDSRQIQLSSVAAGSKTHIRTTDTGSSEEISVKEDTEAALPSVASAAGTVSDGTSLIELQSSYNEGALIVKGYLEGADEMMQKLEKAVDSMHSHSLSSRSSGKNAALGVSKLIQAFESKANIDDSGTDENSATEGVGPLDPYCSAKEQISCLGDVLRAMTRNVEHMDSLIMEENSRYKAAIISCGELEVEVEALKGICNNLEARNIELEVICGAMKQHARDTEAKKTQLEDLCEALKTQHAVLQLQNSELVKKFTDTHSRISGLQVNFSELRKISGELVSTVFQEVEIVQRQMRDDIFSVEKEWSSAFSKLAPIIQKLDVVVRSAVSYPLPYEVSHDLDDFGSFSTTVSTACEVIKNLKSRLEAHDELSSSYKDMEEKLLVVGEERNLAIVLLQKLSADLVNLLNITADHFDDDGEIHSKQNSQEDPLDASYYEALVAKLGKFIGDLTQLEESNSKLSADLLNKVNEIEKLGKSCLDTDTLMKLILEIKKLLNVQEAEVDLDEAPAMHLQSSLSLLLQKYKELEDQTGKLSKDVNFRVTEYDELQGKVELMNCVIIQQQNDILVLRESLVQAKDGFDALQAELLQKVKELEQSEQRVASVREKLSIAVAKGKGLVVQRDNLKHSLSEMSNELENCMQELQLKDSRILEVEEKLKNYSEAGERMEALDSELTYIRNSATALRESFLMKDSTLQRIEEILEDLELPDHFHSKDIIEKVDWIAKTVAGNYLQPADWDQRSSVGGGSYSDTGFVVTDGGKDDLPPTSNVDDDLKKKYEELQTKFYELAEQNDMLEQSLMERNILVQRWEEILDRINTPTQIRSMEPEERIHWLGTALSEADQHMRSLQQKIETLENYCESLSNDLDESQSKIYELESSLETIVQEKEVALSEADERMKSLQQKTDNYESYCGTLSTDLEDSRRRISELESSLEANVQEKETALSEADERMKSLQQKTDNYESYCGSLSTDLEDSRRRISELESSLEAIVQEKETALSEADERMKSLQQKTDNYESYCVSLSTDLEGSRRRISELESSLQAVILEKEFLSSSLVTLTVDCEIALHIVDQYELELDSFRKKVDAHHDSVAGVWEQSSEHASKALMVTDVENEMVREKYVMNMDDSKSRSIVDEGPNIANLRRELAEAMDESVSLREERDVYLQKNQSLVTEFEERDRRMKELQELLNQEEQKSASLREKLNLAVRKGKSLVQQRDGLKQSIEEMTAEIDRLRSTISSHEVSLMDAGQKISDLSLQIETFKTFEAENLSLKNLLVEAEQHLQQNGHTLSLLIGKLGEINTGEDINAHDPLQKLEGVIKMYSDLQLSAASFEQESKRSKKSAELLLAELNEVQERNDGLQEELERAYNEISNLANERDLANSAKIEALSQLGKISEERENQLAELMRLKSSVLGVKNVFFDISTICDDMFAKDIELLHNVRAHMESFLDLGADPIPAKAHVGLAPVNSRFKDFWSKTSSWGNKMPDPLEESAGFDVCKIIEQHLQQLTETISDLKEKMHSHSMSFRTEAECLSTVGGTMVREIASQRSSLESIKVDNIHLESIGKEKDMERAVMHRSLSRLYEACSSSIVEIEIRKAQLVGETFAAEDMRTNLPALPAADGGIFSGVALSSYEESVNTLADKLLVAVKGFVDIGTKSLEGHSKEMKTTILDLQKELQEKDIQREQICMELVSQIKEAEAAAATCSQDLQSMTNYAHDLENKLEALGKDRSLLEQRVGELQQDYLSSTELGEKVKALTGVLAAKDQEIEALMQALDEEENQMEALRSKIEALENAVQKKNTDLEHVEASRAKALKKLSVTVSKFDELHHMSEGLLSEIENLQSQLQDRDAEVSFLRQEVTRCTNDVLEATRMAKERSSGELHDFLTWLNTLFSGVLKRELHGVDGGVSYPEIKEHVQKYVTSVISELEDLRSTTQSKDMLLQAERNKIEELLQTKAALEATLHEKELHLNSLQGVGVSGLGTSEIVEVEPVLNKWTSPITSSQVRSLRKVNNDQVSIAIDTDAGISGRIDDEEDDKVHGFKSLTTSRFVPKFTRPVSDMIDGLWVSCDRTLMRQPAFRLGIMLYWALLHAFLASFIV